MILFKSYEDGGSYGPRECSLHYAHWVRESPGTIHTLESLQKVAFSKTVKDRLPNLRPGSKLFLHTLSRTTALYLVRMTDEEIEKHFKKVVLEEKLSEVRKKIYAAVPKELREEESALQKELDVLLGKRKKK